MDITQLLFGFNGRIRRTNYWLAGLGAGVALSLVFWVLFFIFGGATALAIGAGGMSANGEPTAAGTAAGAGGGILLFLLFVAYFGVSLWISLALQIKRWHDRDKSGVWVFINFIPFVGAVWTLIECGFMDGTMGPNRFGPSPKGIVGPPPMQPVGPAPAV